MMKGMMATLGLLMMMVGYGTIAQAATEKSSGDLSRLEAGTYFAPGSMFSRSYRVVGRQGDRVCVKIANGPASPYEGYQNLTVSTVVQRDGQAIVTATGDVLTMSGPRNFGIGGGRSGMWELLPGFKRDLSEGLNACLTGQGDYGKTVRGPFITGMIYPNAPAELVAKQAKSRINVRQEPGDKAEIKHYGLAGDRVKLLYSSRDQVGELWYQVKFEDSGAEGWVRGDFVLAPGRAAIAPEQKPVSQDAFLIVPGQSVGKITKQTDRQGLVTIFGAANVEDFIERGPEGLGEAPATRVKIAGKESLRVIWQEQARRRISSIAIYDSRWRLADGLAVGTTVAVLEQKFGKFEFYGFGWDYSGTVISESNPKLDKYRQSRQVSFTLGVPYGRCQQFQEDCQAVSGDATFASDDPRLKSLMPRIEVLYVRF